MVLLAVHEQRFAFREVRLEPGHFPDNLCSDAALFAASSNTERETIMFNVTQSPAKLIVSSISLLLLLASGEAIAQEDAGLTVNVTDIQQQQGNLMIAVFEGEDAYRANRAVDGRNVPANATSVSVVFDDLGPGEYGIKIFHDVNGDGELNTGLFGIPSEPYGFSNNAAVRFGPPGWSAARFSVSDSPAEQTISLSN